MSVMLRGQWLNAKGEVGPLGPAAMFNIVVRGELTGVGASADGNRAGLSRERLTTHLPLAA